MFSPKHLLLPALAGLLALPASAAAQQMGLLWDLNGTPYDQAVADFDGTPGLEIALVNFNSGDIELRDGVTGIFLVALPRRVMGIPTFQVLDLNGDGDAELLVLGDNGIGLDGMGAYDFTSGGKGGLNATELWFRNAAAGGMAFGGPASLAPLSREYWLRDGIYLFVLDALNGNESWRADQEPLLPQHDLMDVQVLDLDGSGDEELLVRGRVLTTSQWITYVVDYPTGTPAPQGAGGARATLFPAFPNPAGAGTRIDFSLTEATAVQLVLYDVQGRRVRTLLDQRMPAGRHDLRWDGTDDNGARVASGAYYYELRIPGQQPRARKLLQLR